MGGICLVLAGIQAVTGLLLLFSYSPEISRAYPSILVIQHQAMFGKLFRNLHHWGANFLIIVVFCHMLRVFFTGAYGGVRKANWWIGLGLFICIITANFTGYLLPFDQLSYWAITISTAMCDYVPLAGVQIKELILGGPEICQATLSGFYAVHIALVPVSLTILLVFHFWKIRKAGGVIPPCRPEGPRSCETNGNINKVPALPHLVTREVSMTLVATALVFVFSVLFDAPLAGNANAGMSPNPASPPWYFAGLQELLRHFHPTAAVFIIPLFFCLGLVLLPLVKKEAPLDGTWFISATGRKTGLVSALWALILVPGLIISKAFLFRPFGLVYSTSGPVVSGLVPFVLIAAVVLMLMAYVVKIKGASRNETIQAVSIFFIVSFIILTVAGVWFHGSPPA